MLHKKKGMPQEGEVVFCTVTKVHFHSVFVTLDEYERKSGMIHISEVSPGRIRNIRDYVKEGKVIVCKVLRINKERGHIDLSLRRVNESQRRAKVEERKQQTIAENIFVSYAQIHKDKVEKIYEQFSKMVLKTYPSLYSCFEDVVENNASLEKIGFDKEVAQEIEKLIRERIKPKEVQITGVITIHSFEENGVVLINATMDKIIKVSEQLSLKSLGAGNYEVIVTAPDYKEAEKILKKATDILEKNLNKTNTEFKFERK